MILHGLVQGGQGSVCKPLACFIKTKDLLQDALRQDQEDRRLVQKAFSVLLEALSDSVPFKGIEEHRQEVRVRF